MSYLARAAGAGPCAARQRATIERNERAADNFRGSSARRAALGQKVGFGFAHCRPLKGPAPKFVLAIWPIFNNSSWLA